MALFEGPSLYPLLSPRYYERDNDLGDLVDELLLTIFQDGRWRRSKVAAQRSIRKSVFPKPPDYPPVCQARPDLNSHTFGVGKVNRSRTILVGQCQLIAKLTGESMSHKSGESRPQTRTSSPLSLTSQRPTIFTGYFSSSFSPIRYSSQNERACSLLQTLILPHCAQAVPIGLLCFNAYINFWSWTGECEFAHFGSDPFYLGLAYLPPSLRILIERKYEDWLDV